MTQLKWKLKRWIGRFIVLIFQFRVHMLNKESDGCDFSFQTDWNSGSCLWHRKTGICWLEKQAGGKKKSMHKQKVEMKLEKYGNVCTFLTSNKKWERRKKGGEEKLNRIMFLSLSFPSPAAILPLWHSGCCVFVWDMDLDVRMVTAHSAHSSVVRSPLLDVEQIDFKCRLFEGHISQLLTGSPPPPTPASLRLAPASGRRFAGYRPKGAPGSCRSRLRLQVRLRCSRSAV